MRIIGLSSFKHDTAAAVLEDGLIKAAIENDKLVRFRSHGQPEAAIRACLERAGTGWEGIDTVAMATCPLKRFARKSLLRVKRLTLTPVASTYYLAKEIGILARELNNQRVLRQSVNGGSQKVISFEHHLCHAANAFFLSSFDRALIITMDEDGDGISAMVAAGEENHIRRLRIIAFPHSLAWVYSLTTALIGFVSHRDEHKTQWLSLAGEPVYKDIFLDMFRQSGTPLPRLNSRFFDRRVAGRSGFSAEFYRCVGLTEGCREMSETLRRALACSVQQACTEIVIELIAHCQKTLGSGPFAWLAVFS